MLYLSAICLKRNKDLNQRIPEPSSGKFLILIRKNKISNQAVIVTRLRMLDLARSESVGGGGVLERGRERGKGHGWGGSRGENRKGEGKEGGQGLGSSDLGQWSELEKFIFTCT